MTHPDIAWTSTEPWALDGACAQVGGDAWYPRSTAPDAYDVARDICITCPVTTDCLAYALANETPTTRFGMWGGLTPSERADLVRRAAA